jgi:CDP-diacylglycerol--serine O-phosphatidyltransferase
MQGLYDRIILTYFVACGVSRLARYNVTADTLSGPDGKVKYFEGTPIPTSILIVALLGVAFRLDRIDAALWFGAMHIGPAVLHPLSLVYAASGSAMISATLHIKKP